MVFIFLAYFNILIFSLKSSSHRWGIPDISASKESACSAGNPNSFPRWGRSPEERIGYPLQYSRASLMAQMVKNPPARWETWVRSLG